MQKKIVTIIILVILLAAGFYFFSGKLLYVYKLIFVNSSVEFFQSLLIPKNPSPPNSP